MPNSKFEVSFLLIFHIKIIEKYSNHPTHVAHFNSSCISILNPYIMPLVPTFQRVGQSSSCLQLKTRLSPRRTRPSIRATAFPTSSEGASSLPPPPPPPPLNALAPLVEGKKFTCTECGKCCSGAGEVWANSKEVAALAKSMGLAEKHFKSKFTKSYSKRQGWFLLQRKQGSGECIFLKDGKRCTVYNARPMQCLTVRRANYYYIISQVNFAALFTSILYFSSAVSILARAHG